VDRKLQLATVGGLNYSLKLACCEQVGAKENSELVKTRMMLLHSFNYVKGIQLKFYFLIII
jgi:hypothetical protein